MLRSAAFLFLLGLSSALIGCNNEDPGSTEDLQEIVNQQRIEIDEAVNAARVLEDLYGAENKQRLECERRTLMKLPAILGDSPLSQVDMDDLPEGTRTEIMTQIQTYQSKVASEFEALREMNDNLQRQIGIVNQSVKVEAKATREAGEAQSNEVRLHLREQEQRLSQYLESVEALTKDIEGLILEIRAFEDQEISCTECWGRNLKKKAQREAKKQRAKKFTDDLILGLSELQRKASTQSSS